MQRRGKRVGVLCGVSAALLVATILLFQDREPAPTPPAVGELSPAAATDAPVATLSTPRVDSGERERSATPLIGATPEFVMASLDPEPLRSAGPRDVLTGRVAWEDDGIPIEGCRISFTLDRSVDEELLDPSLQAARPEASLPDDLPVAVTDRHGRFELLAARPRSDLLLRLVLPDDGGVELRPLAVRPLHRQVTYIGEILVRRRGVIVGHVVSTEGQPTAGVDVRLLESARFDSETLTSGERNRLFGIAHRYDPRGGLAGKAARQRARSRVWPAARTGPNGRFVLKGVPSGRCSIALTHPELGGRQLDVPLQAEGVSNVGRVELQATALLSIRLVEYEEGPPVPGHQLTLKHPNLLAGTRPRRTDEDGRVWFTAAVAEQARGPEWPDGRSALEVMHRRAIGDPWGRLGSIQDTESEFVVPNTRQVLIASRSASGIEQRERPRIRTLPRTGSCRFDVQPNGRVLFHEVPHGVRGFVVLYPGHAPAVVSMPQFPVTDSVVDLTPTFAVDILARDFQDRPLDGALVEVRFRTDRGLPGRSWAMLGEMQLGHTDESGRLQARAVWDASAALRIHHPLVGTSDWTPVERFVPGATIVLREQGVGSVRGYLTARGLPTSKRYVIELTPESTDRSVNSHRPRAVVSDLDGSYELTDVPAGSWIATVRDAAFRPVGLFYRHRRARPSADHRIAIQADNVHALDLELYGNQRKAEVTGILRGGLPGAAEWRIVLRSEKFRSRLRTEEAVMVVPDPTGAFHFPHEPYRWDGKVVLEVRGPFGWEAWQTVEPPENERIEMIVAHGAVTLALFDNVGDPLRNCMIALRPTDGSATAPVLTRVTDSHGTLHDEALPAGDYSLQVKGFGQSTPRFPDTVIQVRSGRTQVARLTAATD